MSRRETASFVAPLAITFVHQIFGSFFLIAATILAPLLAERAQVPSSLIGAYMSVTYMAAVVSSGFSGYFFFRFGALAFSTACVTLTALGFLLLGYENVWLIGCAAILVGLGYGPLTPASSHVLATLSPPRWKNTILAAKQTGVPFGGMLAGLLLPWWILSYGWTIGLLIPAVLSLAVTIAMLPSCRRIDILAAVAPPLSRRNRSVLPSRWMLSLGGGAFCYAGVQMSLTTFLSLYFVEHVGLSLTASGAMIAVFQVAGLVMRMVWGTLADRVGERIPLFPLIGLFIVAATSLFLSVAQPGASAEALFLSTVVLGTFGNSWTGLYFAEIIRSVPSEDMGRTTGIALMFTFAGVVAMPPVVGVVLTLSGYSTAFAVIAGLGAVGASGGFLARRVASA
jgi:MFS family permease